MSTRKGTRKTLASTGRSSLGGSRKTRVNKKDTEQFDKTSSALGNTLVVLRGQLHELEMEIGMDEAASGFAYLVDQDGRVRWSKRCMPTHWRKRAEKGDDPAAVEARGAARLSAIADEMVAAVAAVAAEEGVERLKTKVRR